MKHMLYKNESLWYKLPKSIWCKIFEYDSTYHEIYECLRKEFLKKMPFWRINWVDDKGCYRKEELQTHNYISTRKIALDGVYYWNITYSNFYATNNMGYQAICKNCEEGFITDVTRDGHKKILRYLKTMKNYVICSETDRWGKLK